MACVVVPTIEVAVGLRSSTQPTDCPGCHFRLGQPKVFAPGLHGGPLAVEGEVDHFVRYQVRPYPQPIPILVVDQGLDAGAFGHRHQAVHRRPDRRVALTVDLAASSYMFITHSIFLLLNFEGCLCPMIL